MRDFTNNLFIFWSSANEKISKKCFKKFVKTITLNLSKHKYVFRKLQKNFLGILLKFAAAKISTNWPYKVFDEWVNSCFSESIFLCDVRRFPDQVRAFAIVKESYGWLRLEWMLVIAGSIKMNKSRTLSEAFCGVLDFGTL